MKFAVLGTGMVGRAIAGKLAELGHEVRMGSRAGDNPKAVEWARSRGERASHGTYADAAAFGAMVFNCTNGAGSIDALRQAGSVNLAGKVLVDVANPLEVPNGMPPSLFVCNTDSLGERIQREFPAAKVVKTLNTVNASIMVDPARLPGEHDVFLSGNDPGAKAQVAELLRSFGWRSIIDLGDITTARGPEMWLPLWLRLWGAIGSADFNLHVVRAPKG